MKFLLIFFISILQIFIPTCNGFVHKSISHGKLLKFSPVVSKSSDLQSLHQKLTFRRHTLSIFNGDFVLWNYLNNDEDIVENTYTTKQILKEETEAPFRKIRLFIYFSLLGAASIGVLISGIKLLVANSGGSSVDFNSLLSNFAINAAGIPVLVFLWKREIKAQNSKLERIQKGGGLAGLRVKISAPGGRSPPVVVKLSDLRRDRGIEKSVIIIAAEKGLLLSSLSSSIKQSSSISSNGLIVIPLQIDASSTNDMITFSSPSLETLTTDQSNVKGSLEHIGTPVALPSWNTILKRELATAVKQQPDVIKKGITLVIKTNGKVGSRRFGVPIWEDEEVVPSSKIAPLEKVTRDE